MLGAPPLIRLDAATGRATYVGTDPPAMDRNGHVWQMGMFADDPSRICQRCGRCEYMSAGSDGTWRVFARAEGDGYCAELQGGDRG